MAAFYQFFVAVRNTEPDRYTLRANILALDSTAGIQHEVGNQDYKIKKGTVWTQNQINAVQNVLNTSPASTPQLSARTEIKNWSISQKAFALALVKQLNTIRAALPTPLPPMTLDQVLAAVEAEVANVPG